MIPKDYQLKAVDSLRNGSILCGGVGSGKSFTALLYFSTKVQNVDKLFIITTAKKRDSGDWEEEVSNFDICKTTPVVVDSWNNIQKYVGVENAFFIFDEQRVVGYGQWSKSFIHIAKKNQWILLSATPGDTWLDYIPVFIANGFYKNKSAFIREHVVYSRYCTKYPKIDRYINEKKLESLRELILVDMDFKRETKRHHYWIKADYNPDLYFRIWEQRWNIFEDKPIVNIAELFMCIRKLVNMDSSRFDILTEVLKLHKKVILFYNFDYELDILREYCETVGYPYSEWNGHKHQDILEGNRWIYLVQYTAGSEGWNCIKTDTVIFWSQNYSYKVMEQSCGRIDRLNTPYSDLYYFHIYSSSKIDKAIKQAVSNKEKFNEKAFLGNRCEEFNSY